MIDISKANIYCAVFQGTNNEINISKTNIYVVALFVPPTNTLPKVYWPVMVGLPIISLREQIW